MDAFALALDNIREDFFTFEEFPFVAENKFPQFSFERINPFSLKAKEIEALILEIPRLNDMQRLNEVTNTLCQRRSKRVMRLFTSLFQYNHENDGMRYAARKIQEICNHSNGDHQNLIARFGGEEDIISALVEAAAEKNELESFFKQYWIMGTSPLATAVSLEYFARAQKIGLLKNMDILAGLIEREDNGRIKRVLDHYLNTLNLVEYSDIVNLTVLAKLGEPYISEHWADYSAETREKFAKWSFLYRLREHSRDQEYKFNILARYLDHIKTNYFMESEKVLIIDFGPVIVADVRDGDGFLYERSYFEKEIRAMSAGDEDEGITPIFLRPFVEIMTARKFMLSTDDAPCIRLNFEGINRYYIEELFDIKLELEPDMREMRRRG